MKSATYQDGYKKFGERIDKGNPPDLDSLKRAVKDCKELGWNRLGDYFQGGITAEEDRRRRAEGK